MIFENIEFRVCPFLFRARHDDAHGYPLQRGAPTVGAIGDAAMDENGRAMEIHSQCIMGSRLTAQNMRSNLHQTNVKKALENTLCKVSLLVNTALAKSSIYVR